MGIIENFKDAFKIADSINNLDLYRKLSELQTYVLELEEENLSLKERLRRKDQSESIAARLVVRDNAYYLHDGERDDGPFCMRCWDVDRILVRERSGATPGTHFCTQCGLKRR
jgi:hypothetical protein